MSSSSTDADQSLFKTNEIFGLLVNAVNEYAIFCIDTEGFIKTWNSGGKRLKGYSAEEIIGTHFSSFYSQSDKDKNHPKFELEQAKLHGKYEEEGWRVKQDGSVFWASVVLTSLYDTNGTHIGFAKVTRDLTERKNAEDQLKKANDNLEQRVLERTAELAIAKEEALNAVRTRDEFLSIASHELNTPITSLKLQSQFRRRQMRKGDDSFFTKEAIEKMFLNDEKQINRLGRLVDDMLDISRLNSGKLHFEKTLTDLNKLVSEVISRFQPELDSLKIPVSFECKKQISGNWDRYRIDQVITNLLTNAMKYGSGKPIAVNIDSDEKNAYISVADQGIGISPEDQERIFNQYERAISPNSISGLGLGLYIVTEILSAHNAFITLKSKVNAGSTFTVNLPLNS